MHLVSDPRSRVHLKEKGLTMMIMMMKMKFTGFFLKEKNKVGCGWTRMSGAEGRTQSE